MKSKSMFVLLALVGLFLRGTALQAVERVWSGAGANKLFSNPANWVGGTVPKKWDPELTLLFPTNGTTEAIVDITGLKVELLDIRRGNFNLHGTNGATLTLIGSASLDGALWYETVGVRADQVTIHPSLELVLSNYCAFYMPGVQVCHSFQGIKLCNNDYFRLNLNGPVSGNGSLILQGLGLVTLGGTAPNTYTGVTQVRSRLILDKPIGVNAVPGDVQVVGGDAADHDNHGEIWWQASHQIPNSASVTVESGMVHLDGAYETVGPITLLGSSIDTGTGILTLKGDLFASNHDYDGYDYPSGLYGNVNLGILPVGVRGRTFEVAPDSQLYIHSVLSGSSATSLRFTGGGAAVLLAANSYSGSTFVIEGAVWPAHAFAFGSAGAGTTVYENASLVFGKPIEMPESFTLYGSATNADSAPIHVDPVQYQLVAEGEVVDPRTLITLTGTITITNNVALNVGYVDYGSSSPKTGPCTLNLSGKVTGDGSLVKEGPGQLRFSGTTINDYTGETRVNDGSVELKRVNGGRPIPGPLVIGDGIDSVDSKTYDNESVTSYFNHQIADNATVVVRYPAILELVNTVDTIGGLELIGGGVATGNGYLQLNGDLVTHPTNVAASITGSLYLGNTPRVFDVAEGPVSPDLNIVASITGSGFASLIKEGAGQVKFWGANTYQGWTFLNQGRIVLATPQGLGDTFLGTVVASNAVLELSTQNATVNEPLTLFGGTLRTGSKTNTWNGPVSLTVSGTFDQPWFNAHLVVPGVINGYGGLTKIGSGVLELTGPNPNAYDGPTDVLNGTLVLHKSSSTATPLAVSGPALFVGSARGPFVPAVVELRSGHQIGDLCAVTINATGTLIANGQPEVIGSLAGAGNVSMIAGNLTCGGNGSSTVYSGSISGSAGIFTKAGSGVLELAGTNTHNGYTFVTGGTLLVNGAVPNSTVSLLGGTTLGGNGQVGPILGQLNSATLSPGNGPGLLRSGSLLLGFKSAFAAELNGTTPGLNCDQLKVAGTVTLGGATLQASLGFAGAVDAAMVLIDNDGTDPVVGTFAGLPEGATITLGGAQFAISYQGGTGNDVVLTQISAVAAPELNGLQKLPDGQIQISGTGIPGSSYRIEANSDLNTTNWLDLGEMSADPQTGALQFIDPDAPGHAMRFYRFVIP